MIISIDKFPADVLPTPLIFTIFEWVVNNSYAGFCIPGHPGFALPAYREGVYAEGAIRRVE
jgi:hypothetical protein